MQTKAPRIPLVKFAKDWAPKQLAAEIRQYGDDEFLSPLERGDKRLNDWLPFLPKPPEGLFYSEHSAVLLKVKNVTPHDDSPVGNALESWTGSCIGILNSPKDCYFQVGFEFVKVEKGDWFQFDDAILHSLQSKTEVHCISIQLGSTAIEESLPREPAED